MPARYNSSAASSLCSQPMHSRASSRTAVVTPLEDFRTSRYVPTDNLAPVEDRSRHSSRTGSSKSSWGYEHKTLADGKQEPYDSYFAIPTKQDSNDGPAPLTRKRTTKELVGRFESLSSAAQPIAPRASIASSKQTSLTTPESREKKKGRSPIRQSFRNLLSVFSKKGRIARDPPNTLTPDSSENGLPIESLLSPKVHKLEPLSIPNTSQVSTTPTVACNTPSSLYTGQLLYMSRPTAEDLPVWTDCNVLLHPTHILVTWMTSHSNPSTSIVTLAQCTDVRSLALDDLVEEERGMLPSMAGSDELFVFELLFEGKSRQKFATQSIKDRAGWVSAIWDAVLRMSEEKTYTPSINALREITQLETPLSSPLRGYMDGTLPLNIKSKDTPTKAPTDSELPNSAVSTPSQAMVPKSPVRVTLYDPPVPKQTSPISTPTRTAPSLLSSPASTRSQSPSIRNLDRISVVKQRLAEIEANSRSNSPTTPIEKSTRGRQILGGFPESPVGNGPKRSVLLRHGTITTIGGDSVASVQMNTIEESDLEDAPRPLVSIPSGESLGTVANPWSLHSRLSTPEPLRRLGAQSVASNYSSDSPITERPSSFRSQISSTNKPLPRLVLALQEASSTDGDKPIPTPSHLDPDTPTSTRSLSIFSPQSRYSRDAAVQEQATALSQRASPVPPLPPASVKSTPKPTSIATVLHSLPITNGHAARNSSDPPQKRRGIFSHTGRPAVSIAAPQRAPEVALDEGPSELPYLTRTSQPPPVAITKSEPTRNSLQTQLNSGTHASLPLPSLSVFSPRWKDSDDDSVVDSQPEATLFSRFAKILPDLPITSRTPVVQEVRKASLPSGLETHQGDQICVEELEGKINEIQTELRNLPGQIRSLVAEQPLPALSSPPVIVQDTETKQLLQDMDAGLKRLEDHGGNHAENLKHIHAKIDTLLSRRKSEAPPPAVTGLPPISGLPNLPAVGEFNGVDTTQLMDALEEMRSGLKTDLPVLAQKLEELLAIKSSEAVTALADMPREVQATPAQPVDTTAIHEKLDELLVALQAKQAIPEEASKHEGSDEPNPLLQQVLELLNSDKEDRAKVIEQQADSARYLNELNTWLETFVNHGTSQIESVAGGVQQLCHELGSGQSAGEDGQIVHRVGLLADIRQLLVENKGRDENMAALHGSVNGLMAAVQDNLQQGAELRTVFNQETMAGLIEKQRQNQEQMLRNLAHELSDDIRGERLRFVEAMKEATTINVQIHVEEFKKELTREVTLMTQEVDRLHKERQGLEQHIADLFAFYAKQKQGAPAERRKGKHLQPKALALPNAGPQGPHPPQAQAGPPQVLGPQNVYYGVPGVPGFKGPAV